MAAVDFQLERRFDTAKGRIEKLSQRPTNPELLSLYALFKQATEGDASGERPAAFDFKGRAKFDAWAKLAGLTASEAKTRYVALVDDLVGRYDG